MSKHYDNEFTYSPWRHGGWYVNEVRYPSGAVGCVSRNYPDRASKRLKNSPPGFLTAAPLAGQ
jgi:hypothetical protein